VGLQYIAPTLVEFMCIRRSHCSVAGERVVTFGSICTTVLYLSVNEVLESEAQKLAKKSRVFFLVV